MSEEVLAQRHCEPCSLGGKPLSPEESNRLLTGIPRWKKVRNDEGIEQLHRAFHFRDFKEAFNFAYKVAAMAEREDHHPALLVEWGQATVTWWTHKIGGLHENDFIMAAKTDRVADTSDGQDR
ncbi:MAG: 4a-hydroxytetrahydrobiopterin dehydratase [Pseudohongiellaceae bacterium]